MTVVTAGLVAVAAILAVAVGLAGALTLGRTRAQGAADASALAAASEARDRRALGEAYLGADGGPCLAAREVAERWGATLTSCVALTGGVVTVDVAIAVGVSEASATARAGPASRSRRRMASPPGGRAKRATRCAGEPPVRVPSRNQPECGAG